MYVLQRGALATSQEDKRHRHLTGFPPHLHYSARLSSLPFFHALQIASHSCMSTANTFKFSTADSIIHHQVPPILQCPSPITRIPIYNSSSSTHFPVSTYSSQIHSSLSRRLFLPSVSSIWDALTGDGGNNFRQEAALAIRQGMLLFRQGDVLGSLSQFDEAIDLDPRQKAYLWQRGLSLYYLDRFEEGAEQFQLDVAQNPNDTEESIWCFLCEAQLYGVDEARRRFLEVGRDSRPVMRQIYSMIKDGGDPDKLVAAFTNGQAGEYFYASLYAGLYYEALGKPDASKNYIVAACHSLYGQRSEDYMASLAKVHCICRDWNT